MLGKGVLAILLAGLFIITSASKHDSLKRKSDDEASLKINPPVFETGKDYIFEYNGQIASGFNEPNSRKNYANDENGGTHQQKAMKRIQAQVKIHFMEKQRASLQLSRLQLGELNEKAFADPNQIQPLAIFQATKFSEEQRVTLEKPCEFDYVDGVVNGIRFDASDMTWSKNMKRAVLNLIQVKLRRSSENSNVWNAEEKSDELSSTVPETSIEGACMTTYTIGGSLTQDSNSDEAQHVNITKSVNFKKCSKLADVDFGYGAPDQSQGKCTSMSENNLSQSTNADDESCYQNKANEGELQRSTIGQIECVCEAKGKSCAIKSATILSHYMAKTFNALTPFGMHTITMNKLVFRGVQTADKGGRRGSVQSQSSTSESLMYDNEVEMEKKRFYMFGDKSNAQPKTNDDKAKEAISIYRTLIQASIDKSASVEKKLNAMEVQRLIEILRLCSVNELQQIQTAVGQQKTHSSDSQRVEQLLANTLVAAGTRNAVHVLMKKIHEQKINTTQAATMLKNLNNIPAPSDEIAAELLALCKSELTHRSAALKQSCWLTMGAMIGEMCRGKQKQQQKDNSEDFTCSPQKKSAYKKALVEQYKEAESVYEKVLVLKAIGNAGLENMISEIEKTVLGGDSKSESLVVRVVAIDALRRLRKQMPRKLQRICLPIFQNTKEPVRLRAAAFGMLMSTQPEEHILDQILYTLSKERSRQMRTFVYTTAQAFADSPIPSQRHVYKHLQSALMLSGINMEKEKAQSVRVQIPLYTSSNNDGILVKLVSVYGEEETLPVHLAASLDSLLNGKQNLDAIKVSMTQQNAARYIFDKLYTSYSEPKMSEKRRSARKNAYNANNADEQLREIYQQLGIRSRDAESRAHKNDEHSAFMMLNVRMGDVDQLIVPINEEMLSSKSSGASSILRTMAEMFESSIGASGMRSLSATSLSEKQSIVPTSFGMPLKITHANPMISCVEANVRRGSQSSPNDNYKMEMSGHAIITGADIQKMECLSPLGAAGVESARIIDVNVPLNAQLEVGSFPSDKKSDVEEDSGIKLTWNVPQQKMHVLCAHSNAFTFLSEGQKPAELETRQMRSVESRTLKSRFNTYKVNMGKGSWQAPIRIAGEFRMPSRVGDLSAWLQLAMSTENDIHVIVEPDSQTPHSITFQAKSALFRRTSPEKLLKSLEALEKFYEGSYEDDFHAPFSNDYSDAQTSDLQQSRYSLAKSVEKLRQQLRQNNTKSEMIDSRQMAIYKHSIKLGLHTNGGKQTSFGNLNLDAICDSRFKLCALSSKVECSPIYAEESGVWRGKLDAQLLMPEVSSFGEFKRQGKKKQQDLLGKMEAFWGNGQQQYAKIRIQGKNERSKQMLQEDSEEDRRQMFVNKLEAVCDYKVESTTIDFIVRAFEVLKANNFWSTETETQNSGRNNQLYASLRIEPSSVQTAELQMRTPTQITRISGMQMPFILRPLPLIRSQQKSTHSVAQALARYVRSATHAQCTVSGENIETFDGQRLKGPTTGFCYSVLAYDCAHPEHPRYAVLLKNINKVGQRKKVKVIVPGQVIDCKNADELTSNKKIACYINGKPVKGQSSRVPSRQSSSSSSEEEDEYKPKVEPIVEFNNEKRTSVTITAPSGALTVRFDCHCDNCQCQMLRIELDEKFKHTQCGLCGHFNGDGADEWRQADGKNAAHDPAAFHRSYSIGSGINGEDCQKEDQDNFYEKNKGNFVVLNTKTINTDGQWSDEKDEDMFGDPSSYTQEEESNNIYADRLQSLQSENIEPVLKTKIVEYQDKSCYSMQPVKQCPSGSIPYSKDELQPWDSDDVTPIKVAFSCVPRHQSRSYSNNENNNKKATFSMTVDEPKICRRF